MEHSSRYVVLFAAAVCGVCAIFVSGSAVLLKERQEENKRLDLQKKVLALVGLMEEGERLPGEEIRRRFEESIVPRVVTLETGHYAEEIDAANFDQRQATADPETSRVAAPNTAKVIRVPDSALVYHVQKAGKLGSLILPVQGYGLWSTLYGYIALAPDSKTIVGITFYKHGETPGLGGEVDNPGWKAKWPGRTAFDSRWQPAISVKKGIAGPPETDPYQVDGLSGATITSRGVTSLVRFWLGEDGFGPYLANYRAEAGT